MNATLTLPSPAKINLFLHITGRRQDGYHLLQSVFQLIELHDTLHFTRNDSGELSLSPAIPGVNHEDNLIVRAARLLQQHTGCKLGADIALEKHLPMGGGIGGGSSNAATTLLALNRLWQLELSLPELAQLGLQLGADVPVFIHGHSAWAQGVGEILTPLTLPEPWFVLLHPRVHIATADVFGAAELCRHTPERRLSDFAGDYLSATHNDCQPVAESLFPEVRAARQWLEQFAPARMTGTGACVFAPFDSEEQARRVAQRCPPSFDAYVSRGLNRSPVHQMLALH